MVRTEILTKYFPDLDAEKIHQFEKLERIYAIENEKVNLISRKDFEHLFTNHILHSLSLAKTCSVLPGQKVLDIGTGGGFPGIPLAIMFPQTTFILCDSIGKKIRAVQAIIDGLELKNAFAVNDRTEQLNIQFDIAVARAVAPMAKLWDWMAGKWKNKALFYLLKGGDLSEEMNELLLIAPNVKIQEFPIKNIFSEEYFETKKVLLIKE